MPKQMPSRYLINNEKRNKPSERGDTVGERLSVSVKREKIVLTLKYTENVFRCFSYIRILGIPLIRYYEMVTLLFAISRSEHEIDRQNFKIHVALSKNTYYDFFDYGTN